VLGLIAASTAALATQAPVQPMPSLPAALTEAARMCTSSGAIRLTLPSETYLNIPALGSSPSKQKRLADAPELVQRYVETAPSTRSLGKPFIVFMFPTSSGDVWVLPSKGPLCDVMVTGSPNLEESAAAFADALPAQGWELLKRVDATSAMPLSQRLLVRLSPRPDAPDYGTRARMQWASGTAAEENGVQFEINFASGAISRATQPTN
jgi:hypothetical protein